MSKSAKVPVNLYVSSGNPTLPTLREGDSYWNSTSKRMRIYNGSAWVEPADDAETLAWMSVSP